MKIREDPQRPISDAEFEKMLERANARGEDGDTDADIQQLGDEGVIDLRPRNPTANLKLEQNLGCELPVCVSNRRDVNLPSIEFTTKSGRVWRLERTAQSKLPAPEYYPYWLWFLDRLQAAAENGAKRIPRVAINPPEIFDLFGGARGGARYTHLDEAFRRFSLLVIRERSAFHGYGQTCESEANLGTLCYYQSWRVGSDARQETLGFAGGWVAPGPLLWMSVQSGYMKSVAPKWLRGLDYVGQRLVTYVAKHCRPSKNYAVSTTKMLPKIPLRCQPNKTRNKLEPHHEALVKNGFLADAQILGRGADKMVIYRRTSG